MTAREFMRQRYQSIYPYASTEMCEKYLDANLGWLQFAEDYRKAADKLRRKRKIKRKAK